MLIRRATLNDLPAVMRLIADVVPIMRAAGNLQWDDTYPNLQVFENDIALNQLWVAEIESSIAGVSAITTDQDAEYAEVGWDVSEAAIVTHRLAVNPAYQGKGVAAALLKKADEVAISRNIQILRIDTNTKNLATQKLFPRMGYRYAGEISLGFRADLRFFCYQKVIGESIGNGT